MPVPCKRWIWIVLDSVGIGAAPDAFRYGAADEMSNTLVHTAEAVGGLHVPNLAALGLGCIDAIPGVSQRAIQGAYGRMVERSYGKDTTNGHWEFVGEVLDHALPVYPHGFPADVIGRFEDYVGKPVLCNQPASGTEVIERFGPEHETSGRPIVYTSADSVFQIAAHERVVPLDVLYDWCAYARDHVLVGQHAVGRVIARPFVGHHGAYTRTENRHDYSLTFGRTVLNELVDAGLPVTGIGKIHDIYGGSGITKSVHTADNADGMRQVVSVMAEQDVGLIYANLVDFDAKYGHRNDAIGFARAIEAFDTQLPAVLAAMTADDTLIITADHGCDPTTPGTDHTRECVPLLAYRPSMGRAVDLGVRTTFADIGATLAEAFALPAPAVGTSFWSNLA